MALGPSVPGPPRTWRVLRRFTAIALRNPTRIRLAQTTLECLARASVHVQRRTPCHCRGAGRFPEDDSRYELVEGRVIEMSPVGYLHSRIVMQFGAMLFGHVRARRLGAVLTDLGVTLAKNPDTVRAPNLAS